MRVRSFVLPALGLAGAGLVAGCAPGPVVYAPARPAVVVAGPPAVVVRPRVVCRTVVVRGPYHWRRVRRCY